jgi:hypothetical protein
MARAVNLDELAVFPGKFMKFEERAQENQFSSCFHGFLWGNLRKIHVLRGEKKLGKCEDRVKNFDYAEENFAGSIDCTTTNRKSFNFVGKFELRQQSFSIFL